MIRRYQNGNTLLVRQRPADRFNRYVEVAHMTHHTAVDVPYFIRLQIAAGVPADYFTERMDNTDIYRIMRSLLGV